MCERRAKLGYSPSFVLTVMFIALMRKKVMRGFRGDGSMDGTKPKDEKRK